jgi:hypothetical protein
VDAYALNEEHRRPVAAYFVVEATPSTLDRSTLAHRSFLPRSGDTTIDSTESGARLGGAKKAMLEELPYVDRQDLGLRGDLGRLLLNLQSGANLNQTTLTRATITAAYAPQKSGCRKTLHTDASMTSSIPEMTCGRLIADSGSTGKPTVLRFEEADDYRSGGSGRQNQVG